MNSYIQLQDVISVHGVAIYSLVGGGTGLVKVLSTAINVNSFLIKKEGLHSGAKNPVSPKLMAVVIKDKH